MAVKFHKVHQFYVCLRKTFTKQNKTQTQINHNFNYLVLEIREDTTLSLSYGYTPLDVKLATSTHTYNKIGKFFLYLFASHKCYIQYAYFFHCMVNSCFFLEDKHQRYTNDRVINLDTLGIQKEKSTMYLLKTAVVGLTFVVTVLFVSYACLGFLMKRNRATHEDLVIINE